MIRISHCRREPFASTMVSSSQLFVLLFIPVVFANSSALLPFIRVPRSSSSSFAMTAKENEAKHQSDLFPLQMRRFASEGPTSASVGASPVPLAEDRTRRKDPLDGFQLYTRGWNISDRHYWASVGFTAAPIFGIAAFWFLGFALFLVLVYLFYFLAPKRKPSGNIQRSHSLPLFLLIFFGILSAISCGMIYSGEAKFHQSSAQSLAYVVNQAHTIAGNMQQVSNALLSARIIEIDNISLPSGVQANIDQVASKIFVSSRFLVEESNKKSKDIRDLLDSVRVSLALLSIITLALIVLGFLLSARGMLQWVYMLVTVGWLLVTGTFIMGGIFLILHSVAGDSCVSIQQWAQNPAVHTALDDILPCVDKETAQETLTQTKQVTNQLVELINEVITNVSNINFSPVFHQVYINQSGPLVPTLCSPIDSNLQNYDCGSDQATLVNAPQEWQPYVCEVSAAGVCVTPGRLTPTFYIQMTSTANISYVLYMYASFLVQLQDCTFVRDTFTEIYLHHCAGFISHTQWVCIGLVALSVATMLSVILWIVHGRERAYSINAK